MKLKIDKHYQNSIYLSPEDKLELFKHCSGGAISWEAKSIAPIIELIEIHGESVVVPHVEMPEAEIYIRKVDGERFIKNKSDDLYYHDNSIAEYYGDGSLYYGQGTSKDAFDLIYFDYE